MGPSRLTRTGLVFGAIAAMFACADPMSSPSSVRTSTFAPSLGVFLPPGGTLNVVEAERVEVCKVYVMTSGAQPPATTNFTVNGPGTVNGAFSLTPGQCREVWVGSNETVTIQEETLAGFTQTCARTLLDASTPACNSGTLATSFVSGNVGAQAGERVVFTNTEIFVPPPEFCTLTLGYWKNHPEDWNDAGDNKPFLTTDLFFNSGQSYLTILGTSSSGGNAYIILAHQYIAAVLNTGGGPSGDSDVDDAIADAAAFFAAAAAGTPAPAKGSQLRSDVLEWAGILDDFNNGLTGPGHCPES